jgi:hypothetical protein
MSDIQALTTQAIKASQERRWPESIELNESILQKEPESIGALNRLAFGYLQTSQTNKAKKAYEKVLELERHNGIAQKYLALIKQKLEILPPSAIAHEDFIDEPGKTKSVVLQRLADPDILLRTAAATPCELVVKNHRVDVKTTEGKIYLGSLPDDIAFRLQKLIQAGNTYSVFVQSTNKKGCVVFIKELARGEKVLSTPSFPVTTSQTPAFQEDVLLEESPLDTRETGNDESESEPEEPGEDNEN